MLWSLGLGTHSLSPRSRYEHLPSDRRKTAMCFSAFIFFFSLSLFSVSFFESGSHFVALGSLDFTMYTRQIHRDLLEFSEP